MTSEIPSSTISQTIKEKDLKSPQEFIYHTSNNKISNEEKLNITSSDLILE